jgi:hypothetical protein
MAGPPRGYPRAERRQPGSRSLGTSSLPAAKTEESRRLRDDQPSSVPLLAGALAGLIARWSRGAGGHLTLFIARVGMGSARRRRLSLTTLDLDYVYLGTSRIVKR